MNTPNTSDSAGAESHVGQPDDMSRTFSPEILAHVVKIFPVSPKNLKIDHEASFQDPDRPSTYHFYVIDNLGITYGVSADIKPDGKLHNYRCHRID